MLRSPPCALLKVDEVDRDEKCETELQFDSASDELVQTDSSPLAKVEQDVHREREQSEATRAESPESLNVESTDDSVHATNDGPTCLGVRVAV